MVLAIDAGTYLTIAVPFGDVATLHDGFGVALGAALEDLGVSSTQTAIEIAAVKGMPFARLADKTLRKALDTVEFVCGTELPYHNDLRVVQRNLNEFPHPLPPHYVPSVAVRRLFAAPG